MICSRALLKKSEFAPTDSLRRRRGFEGGNGNGGGGRGGSGRPIPVLRTPEGGPQYQQQHPSGFPSPGGGGGGMSTRQQQMMEIQMMQQQQQDHVMYDENVIDL